MKKLPKNRSIVQKITRSDGAFKELFGKLSKEDCKKIYDRCFVRLQRRGLSKERIQSFLVDEIRSELFKLLPKPETKIVTDAEKEEREEFAKVKEYPFKMRGFDIWGDSEDRKDTALKDLEDTFNNHVSGYMIQICPRCRSLPCVCGDELNDGIY